MVFGLPQEKYQQAKQEESQHPDRQRQAVLGLGDVLHQAADITLSECTSLPDEALSPEREAAAKQQSLVLLRRAVDAFQQVSSKLLAALVVDLCQAYLCQTMHLLLSAKPILATSKTCKVSVQSCAGPNIKQNCWQVSFPMV